MPRSNTVIIVGVLLVLVLTMLGTLRTMGPAAASVGKQEQYYNGNPTTGFGAMLFGGHDNVSAILADVPEVVRQELERLRNANKRLESAAMLGDGSKQLDRIEELESRLALLLAADHENAPEARNEEKSEGGQGVARGSRSTSAADKNAKDEDDNDGTLDFQTAKAAAASVAEAEADAAAAKAALAELQARHDGLLRRHEEELSRKQRIGVQAATSTESKRQLHPPLPSPHNRSRRALVLPANPQATLGGYNNNNNKAAIPCGSWLKVYVYEFPDDLLFNQYATKYLQDCRESRQCNSQYGGENLLAQFSLELILHDFFKQSCVRTMNPEEAHLFYVPFYNDIEYRWEGKRPDQASKYGQAILDILERKDVRAWEKHFRVTGKYWQRNGGADHIITMSAPVTGLRHPKGTRGWGHYMLFLEQPIFLNLELTRSFVHEYPKCAAKNVVVPYPIPGRNWHNGVWRRKAENLFGLLAHGQGSSGPSSSSSSSSQPSSAQNGSLELLVPDPALELKKHLGSPGFDSVKALTLRNLLPPPTRSSSFPSTSSSPSPSNATVPLRVLNKPIFTYYTGGNHGCTNVRQAISREVTGDERCLGTAQRKALGSGYRKQNPREPFDHTRGPPRQVAMAGAKFCACPEGDSPSAKRQYDAVLTGCIPVIVSNEALYAYSTENGGLLDPGDFSVRITEESVVEGGREASGGLLKQLEAVSEAEVKRLQRNLHRAAHFYRYYAEHDPQEEPGFYSARGPNAMVVNGHHVDPLVAGKFPDGGATEMLLAELEKRADGKLAAACKKEKAEPHYYLRHQHCGKAAVGKEITALERQLKQTKEGSRRRAEIMRGIEAYKEGWISRRRRRR